MCSGFQAGSKRCRGPRANAGDARLAVASKPMAIGASFIIASWLAEAYTRWLTISMPALGPAESVLLLVKLFHPAGQTNEYVRQSSLGDDVRCAQELPHSCKEIG